MPKQLKETPRRRDFASYSYPPVYLPRDDKDEAFAGRGLSHQAGWDIGLTRDHSSHDPSTGDRHFDLLAKILSAAEVQSAAASR